MIKKNRSSIKRVSKRLENFRFRIKKIVYPVPQMVMCCAVNVGWERWREDGSRCKLQGGLMRRAVRLARVATWGKASEHRARATCNLGEHVVVRALGEATDLFLSLRTF